MRLVLLSVEGQAYCVACGHEWRECAEVEAGPCGEWMDWLDCPECGKHSGYIPSAVTVSPPPIAEGEAVALPGGGEIYWREGWLCSEVGEV